jgi:hypothetical protein
LSHLAITRARTRNEGCETDELGVKLARPPADQPTVTMEREFAAPPAAVFATYGGPEALKGMARTGFPSP